MINPELKINDRVVLISMEGEPDMYYGDRGKVQGISKGVLGYKHYKIKWDNGRRLDILEDSDKWMLEDDFDKIKKKKKISESFKITKRQLLKLI